MLEFTALIVVILLYIIPLNLFFYYISEETAISIIGGSGSIATASFYVIYVSILFTAIYLILRFIVVKGMYVYLDKEIEEGTFLLKYKRGQRNINIIGNTAIVLLLLTHFFLRVFDIKVFVLGILCSIFIFKNTNIKKARKRDGHKNYKIEETTETSNSYLTFQWNYDIDPLGIQRPISFMVRIPANMDTYKEYQTKEHLDNSPMAIREHVLDGICPEIADIARQIKENCTAKGFNTFHQVSAVMAFQQSLRYVYDIESKQCDQYLRYPLETLVDGEGDWDCHVICSAAILLAMGYEVVMLRIILPGEDGHLGIAVEGAEGIHGSFFRYNNRTFYYCEITPKNNNFMSFRVGEMPDMPGANITVIPIKEVVSNL